VYSKVLKETGLEVVDWIHFEVVDWIHLEVVD
jgi:hypothetical protein